MIYFGNRRDRHGSLIGNWIARDELGLSIEPAMKQVHGNVPATRWTRRFHFGFAMRDGIVPTRLWINADRCEHEGPRNFGAWSIYWCSGQRLRFTNYLRRVFFERNPDGSWGKPITA